MSDDARRSLQRALQSRMVRKHVAQPLTKPATGEPSPSSANLLKRNQPPALSPRAASPPPPRKPRISHSLKSTPGAAVARRHSTVPGPSRTRTNVTFDSTSPFSFIEGVLADPNTDRFVYLNSVGPYDLKIVDHTEINPDNYYTMSSSGVTHFYKGDSTFVALSQWEREYYLFSKMTKIRFFAQYRMWKAFVFWKKYIRGMKTSKCQLVLQDNLLILSNNLREPILKLRETLFEVGLWDLYHVDRWTTTNLNEFISNQSKRVENVATQLQALRRSVLDIITEACSSDLNRFLIQNGFRADPDEARTRPSSAAASFAVDLSRDGEKISHAERAAIRSECRKLMKFIRLADYFLIDTLSSLVKHCTRKLWHTLLNIPDASSSDSESASSPNEPIFSVEILMDDQHFTFSPPMKDFQNALQTVVTDALRITSAVERLSNDQALDHYTQTHNDDGDNANDDAGLQTIISQDAEFQESLKGLGDAIAAAFDEIGKFSSTFNPFLAIFLEPEPNLTELRDAPVSTFAELIEKFNQQIRSFQGMQLSSVVSIIRADSENLKKLLLPVPERRLADVQNMLPELAREKSTQLLETLRTYNYNISKLPDSVDDFVAFMAHLTRANEHSDVLDDEFQSITSLYALIDEHGIRIPETDSVVYDKLTQTRQTLKTTMSLSEASIEDNITRFSNELNRETPILIKNVSKVADRLKDPMISNPKVAIVDCLHFLSESDAELSRLEQLSKKYQYYQEALEVEIMQFEQIGEVRQDLSIKLELFQAIADWETETVVWKKQLFSEIQVDLISEEVKKFIKTATKASRLLEGNPIIPIFKQKIIAWQQALPMVVDLMNKSLVERHWAEIRNLIQYDIFADTGFTLGTLIEIDAMRFANEINAIAVKAVQEAGLLTMLDKVIATWKDLDFILLPYKDQKEVWVLGSLEDIIASLDESLVTVNTIYGSRYVEPIRKQVLEWSKRLLLFQEVIDEWITCQRKWRYLETIFSAQDIVRQLPEDSKLFAIVNKSWHEIMKRTADDPNALKAATFYPGLKETLQQHNATLDRIEKRLEDYLETKRQAFPRFYFLSNDELLEILAQSKNVRAVQPHLRKCFDNIVSLDFGKDPKSTDILAMHSSEGERVPLGKNLKARGSVELWLCALEADMVKSLHKYMKQGVIDYDDSSRTEWVLRQFGQVVMTVSQIAWARGCEQALRSSNPVAAMKSWLDTQMRQLADLTELVRTDLSSIDRQKVVALVTNDVHARDVVRRILDGNVTGINDFNWQQQLRFYWDADKDDCIVRQVNAQFDYGYEYMGVTSRLVITPLTDRCWMTITGALHIKLGSSPAGPAGTGKTESVKDLAKALGALCVVFNCSDQIDYKIMGKLFSGLAQSGAWACLDEFNRIDIEVLSVIAQQLLQIRQALLQSATEFVFMDHKIPIKPLCGVMVTMNPGYAGRTELPDNLKVMFRPVSMMIPDYALIAEIMLFAEGFSSASILSKKMVKLYKLSSEQLSQQDHYDFGMRAVKSVLVMAGSLKRSQPNLNEDIVLIRAMRDSNIPKFLNDDLPLFNAIVQDLFPGSVIPDADYGILQREIEKTIANVGLQIVPKFTNKVLQLFDTFNVRFGVMLVGPTGSAKTECYKMLSQALTSLKARDPSAAGSYANILTHVLNPKCITMGELYGEVSVLSQEWTDGLASTIMREAIKDTSADNRHWVVFDGPVDALWIENMNTVLDDNMTLCLANGERIKLRKELRMLFEVEDLAVASPATVSRCGMVYMPAADIGPHPYIASWLQNTMSKIVPEQICNRIEQLAAASFNSMLKLQRSSCTEPITTVDINLAASFCSLFQSLLSEKRGAPLTAPSTSTGQAQNTNAVQQSANGDAVTTSEEIQTSSSDHEVLTKRWIDTLQSLVDKILAFSLIWSIGGSISEHNRDKFSEDIRELISQAEIPKGGSVFDFYVDIEQNLWKRWDSQVTEWVYSQDASYFDLFVPTVDSVTYATLMQLQLDLCHSVFFTGVTGVGKSIISSEVLKNRKESQGSVTICMNFSAQTGSRQTQDTIESKLEKKRKTLLGGPIGRQVIIFVDDVNMPAVEQYGAQPPIELLRQFQDMKGFYDREKFFWKQIADSTICCGAAPPGGGRNSLSRRFTRHFHMLCLPSPSSSVLNRIFGKILAGYLASAGFKREIIALCDPIVKSTIQLYFDISKELLPIPAKSHYTFNLRDISKIFQGILMCKPLSIGTSLETMVRLWIHESQRCLYDRLIDDQDKQWFTHRICSLLNQSFGLYWDHSALFENDAKPLTFGDFFKPGMDKEYEQGKDLSSCVGILNEFLEQYNLMSATKMDLVFFADAVNHIVRIARVLRQPRGNLMLVGVGGSGKQSLTRLACAMAEYKCAQIENRKGYGYNEFRDDVKTVLIQAGVQGTPTVFLFSDSQIIEERFLEDINCLLNAGEIPNLFANDELNKITDDLTETVNKMGLPANRDVIYNTFINRVRERLHIVLCLSPVGNSFRVRCRMFPSLINCTTIDWFQPWPEQALYSVSSRFIESLELPSDHFRSALQRLCVHVHISVEHACERFYRVNRRRVYTTPKSYLDLIALFLGMLEEKRADLKTRHDRLAIGLLKMKETNDIVAVLQEDLKKLQPELATKTKETEEMLVQVARDQENADKVKKVVAAEETSVNEEAARVAKFQAEAQADLDLALPALEAAVESLNSLNKSDISEVKAMAKPPKGVVMVCEAVNILLGEKPDWDNCKRVMSNTQYLQILKAFDKDNIRQATIKKVEPYIENEDFNEKVMSKISKAATSLCKWVCAIYTYSQVAKEVEPKRIRLEEMNKALTDANEKLAQKQSELQSVVERVENLKSACIAAVNEKNRLNALSEQTKDRLNRASKLTTGLADEAVRWEQTISTIKLSINNLIGDVFVASATVSYAGPFTGALRDELTTDWMTTCEAEHLPLSPQYTLVQTLGDPVQIREWNLQGLPTDNVSIDSAIMVFRGQRWPLMIDPQGQAKRWIKANRGKTLIVSRANNPNLLRTLEAAVRNGSPVLIEDIDETLESSLDPILSKAMFTQGGRKVIKLGESIIDYDDAFQFYITTKLSNPHYLPEVCIKVNLINFTVTRRGLEDQLLGDVVRKERPDVEENKDRLVVRLAADKKQLKDISDRILKMLSESTGNLLGDEELIVTLADSKFTSNIINERVSEAEETSKTIESIRESYRIVAERGSIIYFVIADLGQIDPMYQYSLFYFNRLFSVCLETAPKSDILSERLTALLNEITLTMYESVCRGLFEAHKLIYSFMICAMINRNTQSIKDQEWGILLRGLPATLKIDSSVTSPDTDLISNEGWAFLTGVVSLCKDFEGMCSHVVANLEGWRSWVSSREIAKAELPSPYNQKLDLFQQMIVLKGFRPEKLMFAFASYVGSDLGPEFVQIPTIEMNQVYRDTDPKTPVIFVLSSGADPTSLLFRFATEKGFQEKLHVISLGQGQGPKASALIEECSKSGQWCLLQNCHLAKSWMPSLETIVQGLTEHQASLNPEFRLWLTSMPCTYFPVAVLQNGVKLTNEPPKGLRSNLLRSFSSITESQFESHPKPGPWKKLLFGLTFFHAIIQERRKFGPLGFNIKYEFNESDLETSKQVLNMFLEEQPEIPWDALRYVCGEINYGGRVTDDWDRRCLLAILSQYYCPDALDDSYAFSPNELYKAPRIGSLELYIDYIQQLPGNDPPEVFGLHDNANIAFENSESSNIVNTVLMLEPRDGGSSNSNSLTADQIVAQIVQSFLDSMPPLLDRKNAHFSIFQLNLNGVMDSLDTVLSQEIDRFNRLLNVIRSSLVQLGKAIVGQVAMSNVLDMMYSSFLANRVPKNWAAAAYPSLKSLSVWMEDLTRRVVFMRNWLVNGRPNAFWLPGFFFPQGFMTGVLQSFARKHVVPIDSLNFAFKVLDVYSLEDIQTPPEDGVVIYGLHMDGAQWDVSTNQIAEARSGQCTSMAPAIHFLPSDEKSNKKDYQCPVYKTSARAGVLSTTGQSTNFILAIDLPTSKPPNHWVLKGAALLCQTE